MRRVAPATPARHPVTEDVAGLQRRDEHRRHPLDVAVRPDDRVRRRGAGGPAGEAVRPVPLPVGPHMDDGVRYDATPRALDREAPVETAGAAGVRTSPYCSITIGHSDSATSTGTFAIDAQ